MNILIVGAGEIGRYLATRLSRAEHNISVIECDAGLAQDLEQEIDAKVVNANGTSVSALAEANVGECELFLALTSSNTVNLVSASVAKALGVGKVVARVHPEVQREEWLFDFRGHFGIDHLFSPERLSAIELAKFIRNPDSLEIEEFARGRIELQQVRLDPRSEAAGTSLRALDLPQQTRVAVVERGGNWLVPDADTVLEAGDVVTIFGEPRPLRELAQRLQRGLGGAEANVVIFGGTEYGFSLAQVLESWNCRVRVFEADPARCRELAERLTNTTVLNADATVVAELEEEQVGKADFFVAASADDEDNVMSCLQAHTLGTKTCLTLIHRADYAAAISTSGKHFGIRAAVSPREATRREIERFLTSERFHVVKAFAGIDLLEARVQRGSLAAGHLVAEVAWPAGVVLVGLLRGLHSEVPGPATVLQSGDILYAVVAGAARMAFVKLLE
jgi:trk system potassium uptake protein TrkA